MARAPSIRVDLDIERSSLGHHRIVVRVERCEPIFSQWFAEYDAMLDALLHLRGSLAGLVVPSAPMRAGESR